MQPVKDEGTFDDASHRLALLAHASCTCVVVRKTCNARTDLGRHGLCSCPSTLVVRRGVKRSRFLCLSILAQFAKILQEFEAEGDEGEQLPDCFLSYKVGV